MSRIRVMARMIFDLRPEIRMAIKMIAVKRGIATGEVVRLAVSEAFAEDIKEAQLTIAARRLDEGGE